MKTPKAISSRDITVGPVAIKVYLLDNGQTVIDEGDVYKATSLMLSGQLRIEEVEMLKAAIEGQVH